MRIGITFFAVGLVLMFFSAAMLIPGVLDMLVFKEGLGSTFFLSAVLTLFFGTACVLAFKERLTRITSPEMFSITAATWLLVSCFSALPFILSPTPMTVHDGLFEAVSGLTSTGATILSGLELMPRALLFWRAQLQWMGGIGIIVLALAIFPLLRIGGMQMFMTESSDRSEKTLPRMQRLVLTTSLIYLCLTILCALCLKLAGMNVFDAVTHALTSVSTGGFSNYDDSVGHFKNIPAVFWILSLFMVFGSLPLIFYVNLCLARWDTIRKETQVLHFLSVIGLIVFVMMLWLLSKGNDSFLSALRMATFFVVSTISSSGYIAGDYTQWGYFSAGVFFFLMLVGGCTGSTSGGVKIFRFGIIYLLIKRQIKRMIEPHRVFVTKYNGKVVSEDVILSVLVYLSIFFLSVVFFTLALTLMNIDLTTALTGAMAAVSNLGSGLGAIIGPTGNFSPLPPQAKLLLSFAMLLGRLEFLTLLILFVPRMWQRD